jgi:hypothetical protein
VDRLTGKITWLSRDRGQGVLASVGGISLAFTHAESADASAFAEGQIVTYRDTDHGEARQGAADVRAHV